MFVQRVGNIRSVKRGSTVSWLCDPLVDAVEAEALTNLQTHSGKRTKMRGRSTKESDAAASKIECPVGKETAADHVN
jgi:hypothetical protein